MKRPNGIRAVPWIAVAAASLLTSVLTATSSAGASSTTQHADTYGTAHATIAIRDNDGKVVYRHRYGPATEGTTMKFPAAAMKALGKDSGSEGSSSAAGTATVGVHYVYRSWPLNSVLFDFKSHVTFTWSRSKQTVSNISHWVTPRDNLDEFWDYDGLIDHNEHYFIWNSSNLFTKSGFHSMKWGHYDGPAVDMLTHHKYPKNVIEVHDDSTWYWTTDCCSPS